MNRQSLAVAEEKSWKAWAARLSWAPPLFFLIKGLLWLAIPVVSAIVALR